MTTRSMTAKGCGVMLAIALVGCGEKSGGGGGDGGRGDGDARPRAYSDEPLAGMVDGRTWTVRDGSARVTRWRDEERLELRLFSSTPVDPFTGRTASPCSFGVRGDDGIAIIWSMPPVAGDRDFRAGSPHLTMTFVIETSGAINNVITDNGRARIDSLGEDRVTGRLMASYDGKHQVNGAFDVIRCDDESLP